MELLHALLYGIIQGLAEFLPISSSAHLALLPHFLKITDPGVAFDLFMHVGTAMAVLIYFRLDVLRLVKNSLGLFGKNRDPFTFSFAISTFITFVLVLMLQKFAENWGRSPQIIAINLIVFGFLLMLSDFCKVKSEKKFSVKQPNLILDAILIGLAQGLAIFPGVSRSGSTITMGRMLNYSKLEASSYSFLLSLPLILGGMVFKFKDLLATQSSAANNFLWSTSLIGLLTSFVVGLLTIHFFMNLIKKIGFKVFFLYRLILAMLLFYFF